MKTNKMFLFLFHHKKHLVIFFIIMILAIVFRLYNYQNRWGLASDQARDALITFTALQNFKFPLIGPFSATGPFVFGPYIYWYLMLIGLLSFNSFYVLWIGQSIISIYVIFFTILIGYELEDIWFGYLLAFFVAVSPSRVGLSTNLIPSTLAGTLSIVASYFFIKSIKYKKSFDYFMSALFISLAINTHFEAAPLIMLLPITFFIGKKNISSALLLILGFIIPFTPLVIFDIQSHFYESSHVIKYLFFNSNPSLTRRWLTYVLQTWPTFWGKIFGGNVFVSWVTIVLIALTTFWHLHKKTISQPIKAITVILFCTFVTLRYFQGTLFGNFTSFIDIYVLIITVWTCKRLFEVNKIVGISIFSLLGLFCTITSFHNITTAHNYTDINSQILETRLIQSFPQGSTFQLYDYKYKTTNISLPLILYLNRDNKLSPTGIKVGVTDTMDATGTIIDEENTYVHSFLVNINGFTPQELGKLEWGPISPRQVYDATENWYKASQNN